MDILLIQIGYLLNRCKIAKYSAIFLFIPFFVKNLGKRVRAFFLQSHSWSSWHSLTLPNLGASTPLEPTFKVQHNTLFLFLMFLSLLPLAEVALAKPSSALTHPPTSTHNIFGPHSADFELSALTALSPLDGRYWGKVKELSPFLREYGLICFRVLVEFSFAGSPLF